MSLAEATQKCFACEHFLNDEGKMEHHPQHTCYNSASLSGAPTGAFQWLIPPGLPVGSHDVPGTTPGLIEVPAPPCDREVWGWFGFIAHDFRTLPSASVTNDLWAGFKTRVDTGGGWGPWTFSTGIRHNFGTVNTQFTTNTYWGPVCAAQNPLWAIPAGTPFSIEFAPVVYVGLSTNAPNVAGGYWASLLGLGATFDVHHTS